MHDSNSCSLKKEDAGSGQVESESSIVSAKQVQQAQQLSDISCPCWTSSASPICFSGPSGENSQEDNKWHISVSTTAFKEELK